MSKNNEVIDETTNLEVDYPYKWIDEYTLIDIEDIRRAKISHDGSGEFVILLYSKTSQEVIEINNKYFEKVEDVRYFIHLIFHTENIDVFDFNYYKEHPEEFEN